MQAEKLTTEQRFKHTKLFKYIKRNYNTYTYNDKEADIKTDFHAYIQTAMYLYISHTFKQS